MDKKNNGDLTRMAKFVGDRIEELKGVRSQRDISEIVGYNTPNMITMIKQGDVKVALDRVAAFAKALDVDAAELYRLAMEQFYSTETIKELFSIVGYSLSENEKGFVRIIREASKGSVPAPTPTLERKIREIFS